MIYPTQIPIDIPPCRGWPASVHVLDDATAMALRAAELLGRPLLLQGEAGLGKSQTARAAAAFAGRPFLSTVITHRTEAQDLLWTMDMVKRLGDAQLNVGGTNRVLPESAYITPGPLWWALNWTSAAAHLKGDAKTEVEAGTQGQAKVLCPQKDSSAKDAWKANEDRAVLLIDEIDKADPDLPNALLEVLGNGGFEAPAGLPAVRSPNPQTRPLVIITTNDERDLPKPFLRRCLVHTLKLPEADDLAAHLVTLAQRHAEFWAERAPEGLRRDNGCVVLAEAAAALAQHREQIRNTDAYKPGTSEYLDLVNALGGLWPHDREAQMKHLQEVARFTFQKQV